MNATPQQKQFASSAEAEIEDNNFVRSLYVGSDTSDSLVTLETERPWGKYRRVDVGHRSQVKRINVAPGASLSLQRHFHRAEHWIVVEGCAEINIDGETFIANEGQSVFIPRGSTHRCANPGKIPILMIEVQIGTYTGEDDITRLEDVYGRI